MKLFQIEEPEGGPVDANAPGGAPGAAIGVAIGGRMAEIAVAVGGNAEVLQGAPGFAPPPAVPPLKAAHREWREFFETARSFAERALARPVTHVVIALPTAPDAAFEERLSQAAREAGLTPLRIAGGLSAAAAAILAEDLAPRSV